MFFKTISFESDYVKYGSGSVVGQMRWWICPRAFLYRHLGDFTPNGRHQPPASAAKRVGCMPWLGAHCVILAEVVYVRVVPGASETRMQSAGRIMYR